MYVQNKSTLDPHSKSKIRMVSVKVSCIGCKCRPLQKRPGLHIRGRRSVKSVVTFRQNKTHNSANAWVFCIAFHGTQTPVSTCSAFSAMPSAVPHCASASAATFCRSKTQGSAFSETQCGKPRRGIADARNLDTRNLDFCIWNVDLRLIYSRHTSLRLCACIEFMSLKCKFYIKTQNLECQCFLHRL